MHLMLLLFLFTSFSSLAHQTSRTSTQKEIRWNDSHVPLKVINNSLSLPNSNQLIEESIAEWNLASSFKISKASSSNSAIKFSNDFSLYGSAVVGLTEVNYNKSGAINAATVLLNEQHYDFTSTPGMALGNQIYLKDVVTHELGHFVGLSHSEVLNSSMFYSNFPGQSELAADDRAGIKSKYNLSEGKIFGYVKGGKHVGVLGAHVQAISRKSGEAIAGITDERGYFEIGGLDLNDSYYLYISPLKNLNSLSGYFANVQNEFCPSAYVGSFFSACGRQYDGLPTAVSLSSVNKLVNVGEVSINCLLRTQEDYSFEKIQNTFTPITIFNYHHEPRGEKSYVGFFRKSELSTSTFTSADKFEIDLRSLTDINGKYLKMSLISQPLGNTIEYVMTISRNGFPVSGSPLGKSIKLPENTLKLDLSKAVELSDSTEENIFEVAIQARKLTGQDAVLSIPDVFKFGTENNLPYLLILSLETASGPVLDSVSNLSDNYSCLDAHFTYSVEKSTASAAETPNSSSRDNAAIIGVGACATVDDSSGPGSGPGSFLGLLSLGFLLTLLFSKFSKRGKNFLS